MKKLADIPKKIIFDVPEGYFDSLPGVIQAKVAEKSAHEAAPRPYFRYAVQFALPVILLAAVGIFLLRPNTDIGAEEMLASVSTQELASYLQDSDITTEQLLYAIEVDDELIDAIEEEAYSTWTLDNEGLDLGLDLEHI